MEPLMRVFWWSHQKRDKTSLRLKATLVRNFDLLTHQWLDTRAASYS